jgi:putative redox protein
MKITLTGGESLRLEQSPGMMTIEALSRDQGYSPFHMLGSALAGCTFWVLQSWGANKGLSFDDLKIDVDWKFAEGEHRVEKMNLRLEWPSLPAELWPRALRAAHVCGIHQTLTHPVEVDVQALGTETPAIESPALPESSSRAAPMPQADGQPRESNPR